MKKKLLSILFIAGCFMNSQAQTFQWATGGGSSDYDNVSGIGLDANNNTYVAGFFSDTLRLGGIVIPSENTTFSANPDMFIAKLDPNGTVLWAQRAGSDQFDIAMDITADAVGNSYVTGYFRDTANFGGMQLISSQQDVLIAKYATDGTILWATSARGTNAAVGNSISVDAAGNVIVAGEFRDTLRFGSTTLVASQGTLDAFVASYDPQGVFQWAVRGSGNGYASAQGVTTDYLGDVLVTGYFTDSLRFGNNSMISSSATLTDIFIAKLSQIDGSLIWIQQEGGPSDDIAKGISSDGSGNVYVAGSFNNAAIFGSTNVISEGVNDSYVAKYDANGAFQWVRTGGGTNEDYAFDVFADAIGTVYITGGYSGSATFDGNTLTSNGSLDVYTVAYDQAGSLLWIIDEGGAGMDYGVGIKSDGAGNVYIDGQYTNAVAFGSTNPLPAEGNADVFIAKIGNAPTLVSDNINKSLNIYPIPSREVIHIDGITNADLSLYNSLGQIVLEQKIYSDKSTINLSSLAKGHYIVSVRSQGAVEHKNIIIE